MFTSPARTVLTALVLAAAQSAMAAPVTYAIDPMHTYPSFDADHMGISTFRGKLTKNKGTVVLDKEAGSGSLEILIDLSSMDFGLKELNTWAQGPEFFNVTKNPSARYKGTLDKFVDGKPTAVRGELTLNGRTLPLDLAINRFKCVPHPMFKRDYCGADASGSFKRDEFGLDSGKAWGFDMTVGLHVQVEAIATQ